ncbi:uncharacterized protein LOC116209890 isoform X2 [Punica granatum]|uniref:Uncharacterized protein LOC116209890 isoform X2 n=2 Tax=Punica granatum TaxID=22663 RepID=A0A6P8DQ19_PUNGR|nr:uncharacterized protein LOC116209890 isoform X2 [Punica granatum]PKI57734.1 hypothetical protein CRG98_021801 [Punica granatum]
MEPLYAKLYDKYTKLKARKFGELEQLNKDQEEKFINYMAAAEELIQHLKDENDRLHAKLNDLISSTRPSVDDQSLDYQKLLMEEIHKNKELSQEVEKLHKLQKERVDGERGQLNDHTSQKRSDMSDGPMTRSRKRSRPPESSGEIVLVTQENGQREAVQEDSENISFKETSSSGAPEEAKQPQCCTRATEEPDDKSTCKCLFQALIQYTLGMQFSVATQVAGICISAFHESSGYSFTLTWADKEASGEVELMYTVQSLGTYERVAPEWMREVIKFSSTMCPIFFNRIARFINVHQ